MFFPLTPPLDFLVTTFAVVGFVAMIMRRNLTGIAIGLIELPFVVLVYVTRDSLPGHRAALEPAAAAVHLPDALHADGDRRSSRC